MTDRQLRNRLEPQRAILIAETEKVIRVALEAGLEPRSMLLEEKWLRPMADVIEGLPDGVPVYVLPHAQMSELVGYNVTRGAFCELSRPRPMRVPDVLGGRRVAVIEDVTDATNLGAIFRSAAALGVDAVLLTPRAADPYNRRALRVSMGTALLVPWARLDSWPARGMDALHAEGYTCAALALSDDSIPLDDPTLKSYDRLALLLGTEGDGLAPTTVATSDVVVRIPMGHGVDSLNVAAASAVAFWELRTGQEGCRTRGE
jgi:tRNA G18 (ribose-2'-O)-methylase SpoU